MNQGPVSYIPGSNFGSTIPSHQTNYGVDPYATGYLNGLSSGPTFRNPGGYPYAGPQTARTEITRFTARQESAARAAQAALTKYSRLGAGR